MSARTLASVLHLTHLFARDAGLEVVVAFMGVFGAICRIAGATIWSCGWYKSLQRLRLADQGARGSVRPWFWTNAALLDISVDTDFDALVKAGMLNEFAQVTEASRGLIEAAGRGMSSNKVAPWVYRPGIKDAAMRHFYMSAIGIDEWLSHQAGNSVEAVVEWLAGAASLSARVAQVTLAAARQSGGGLPKTSTSHVAAWVDSVQLYRRIHSV